MAPALRRVLRGIVPALFAVLVASCGGGDDSTGTPPVATYGLSGTVSHLDAGNVSISDGSETVTVAQGASTFAFAKPLANGTAYTVTVATQPVGSNCVVNNGTGTVSGAAISNVAIVCNTQITQPLAIGVSASGSLRANSSRIFLPVTSVGTTATTINAVLDTGSAGTVLRASDVFPSSMVSQTGFVFNGQSSITYNGVTVTNVTATRTYGAQSTITTELTGNLGFAQVSFGSGTRATTAVMPILFAYQSRQNGVVSDPTNFGNLIGVAPGVSGITVNGMTAASSPPPCTPQSTTTCGLASPFRFFSYAAGIDKGYVLNKVTFAACEITTPGACPVTPSLTLGVTASTTAGFTTTSLSSCGSVTLIGTTSEPFCSQVIPGVTISSGNASFTGPAIFDSGYPTIRLSVPAGTNFPDSLPQGSTVGIAIGSGFAYQYQTGTGYLATMIVQSTGSSDFSNTGIAFFAQNSLLLDYTKALEGWRTM